jgi:RimJ/RimL family protein N-acetyltransferase
MIPGDRIRLRALQPADYVRMAEFKNDVEFELLGGGSPPRPHTEADVRAAFESGREPDSFSFAIELDGRLIGDCGLFHLNRVDGTAELGIGIGDRECWGLGYGRDAVATLVRYAFTLQNLRKVWLTVNADNERAIRCYHAVGFAEEGRQRQQVWSGGQYLDLVLMGLLRDEWLTYSKPARRPRHLNVTDDSG